MGLREGAGVVVESECELEFVVGGAEPGDSELVAELVELDALRAGDGAAGGEDFEWVDGAGGCESVVVNLLDDVGALRDGGVVLAVADFVNVAE